MKRVIAFCALLGASTTLAACDFSYPMVDSAIAPEAMRADYPRLVPITGALLAIWVMRNYDVTEERAHEIRAELEKRRGKTVFG